MTARMSDSLNRKTPDDLAYPELADNLLPAPIRHAGPCGQAVVLANQYFRTIATAACFCENRDIEREDTKMINFLLETILTAIIAGPFVAAIALIVVTCLQLRDTFRDAR